MSSVTRFLRQIPTGLTTYEVDVNSLYVLVPTNGNYVGNYPPATMQSVPVGVVGGGTLRVVRDMGKTVFATVTGQTAPGFFRAVQILNPVSVASPTAQTNFGVQGSAPASLPPGNAGDMGFNTFYVPINLGGIVPGNAPAVTTAPILAGQL
jgi:hypothetical protein